MFYLMRLAVADDDIRLTFNDRPHQVADASLRVLVVAIGVYDYVRAQLQRFHHAVVERTAQPLVPGMTHEMPDPVLLRDLHGFIRGSVIYDQDYYLVNTWNF